MAALSTLGGWVAVIALVGGFWYYHKNTAYRNRRLATLKHATKSAIEQRKEPKVKRGRKDTGASSGDQVLKVTEKSLKKKPTPATKAPQDPPSYATITTSNVADDREDEVDNREFARQFANVQSGTVMAGKTQTAAKQKSVKQSKAQEKPLIETSEDNATAPSSATGGDADDDESPINSPELGATTATVCTRNPILKWFTSKRSHIHL
jgi:hypothetical protein